MSKRVTDATSTRIMRNNNNTDNYTRHLLPLTGLSMIAGLFACSAGMFHGINVIAMATCLRQAGYSVSMTEQSKHLLDAQVCPYSAVDKTTSHRSGFHRCIILLEPEGRSLVWRTITHTECERPSGSEQTIPSLNVEYRAGSWSKSDGVMTFRFLIELTKWRQVTVHGASWWFALMKVSFFQSVSLKDFIY